MTPFNYFYFSIQNTLFLFIISFNFIVGPAHADEIASINLNINTYNLPSQVWIYNGTSGLKYAQSPELGSLNTLVCQSDTDSQFGACPSHATTNFQAGAGNVLLKFCLAGTETCRELTLSAWRLNGDRTQTPPWVATKSNKSNAVIFYYSINKDQLSLLSTGIWKARLVSYLVQWKPGPVALTGWVADIKLNVITDAHPIIFFPDFTSGNPVISFSYSPVTNSVGRRKSLDMCLYDGGTKSGSVSLAAKGSSPTSNFLFSMLRSGGDKNNDSDNIRYSVLFNAPTISGFPPYSMTNNGIPFTINNANSKKFQRQVFIPGVGTVSCLPLKATLILQDTDFTKKNAGVYNDTLTVIYTPNTSSG
ncbi:MAG: hypothetical protein G3W58_22320 [Pantoea ananatis]|nr:hypothetical protein [Pantoea ananatis]